jgi:protein DGCR14
MDVRTASQAVVAKRTAQEVALMPPPPLKKIKRPPKVLDEDDYTEALSDIIARDYFPGLRESQAQNEYLSALESGNQAWIAEAARNLRAASDPAAGRSQRQARDGRFDEARGTPRVPQRAADTPRGFDGSATPSSVAASDITEASSERINTSEHTLSSFQTIYTSEDNASFNDVLDKQNKIRREKHAYHWTGDGRIPTARQIESRAQQQQLIADSKHDDQPLTQHSETTLVHKPSSPPRQANELATIPPLTVGAVASRPAQPNAWKTSRPDNTFMFFADSIDDYAPTMPTIAEQKQLASKAGPKQTVHGNTRFPLLSALQSQSSDGPIPPSPSLNTDVVAARGTRSDLNSDAGYTGAETPRVNGYAFVDEDEPEPEPAALPSYRDLLAGQAPDANPNPFKFSAVQKREALHHRLVEETAAGKRAKEKEATPVGGVTGTPRRDGRGNMTPAAERLLGRLGKTPVRGSVGTERTGASEMWTPVRTPRRKVK